MLKFYQESPKTPHGKAYMYAIMLGGINQKRLCTTELILLLSSKKIYYIKKTKAMYTY